MNDGTRFSIYLWVSHFSWGKNLTIQRKKNGLLLCGWTISKRKPVTIVTSVKMEKKKKIRRGKKEEKMTCGWKSSSTIAYDCLQ